MIKRSAAFVLTLLYLVTTVGFALNLHYCFNRVTAINFDTPAKNCGMPAAREMKCCKQKHLVVKVNDAHQGKMLVANNLLPALKLIQRWLPDFSLSAQHALAEANFRVNSSGPPPGNISPYIKNCVFRI